MVGMPSSRATCTVWSGLASSVSSTSSTMSRGISSHVLRSVRSALYAGSTTTMRRRWSTAAMIAGPPRTRAGRRVASDNVAVPPAAVTRVAAPRHFMRRALPLLLLPLLGVLALAGCHHGPLPPPNLLLIVVDCLRADELSVHGYPRPTSPSLDALAADGVDFRQAYSQSSWTRPSLPTIL